MILNSLLATLLAAAAAPPPARVVSVTIFNDRARIVREANLELHGPARVELALLPDGVEPDSIRLEAKGAEVKGVELIHVDTDLFPEEDARKLLDQLDEADDRLALAGREQKAIRAQLQSIAGLTPIAPEPDLRGPPPKLNSSGWAQVLTYLDSSAERLQARLRESHARIDELTRQRQKLAEEAQALGAVRRRSGLQVTARLSGEGPVRATLTYMIGGARWMPSWQLTYKPGEETVQAQLDGLVWQATGEEWTRAHLDLSTAVPGRLSALPELLSWRIGSKERFVPISHAARNFHPMLPKLPEPRPEPMSELQGAKDRLRAHLLARAQEPSFSDDESTVSLEGTGEVGGVIGGVVGGSLGAIASGHGSMGMAKEEAKVYPPPPPPAAPVATMRSVPHRAQPAPKPQATRSFDAVVSAAPASTADAYGVSTMSLNSGGMLVQEAAAPTEQIGLGAPVAWVPPSFNENSPASLAGGFDLSFAAANPATLESGSSARRIPLFAESWPVHTERLLYPALAPEAWLVAKLNIPSQRSLPGGEAELFVGADPAGHARLTAMAPGEEITLPLGIDRAVKSVRNLSQVQSEKGIFSKDDVDEYVVTIEIANPYSRPTALHVVDQVPRKGNEFVEVEFLGATPAATPNAETGQLEWSFAAPASQKSTLTFSYRLKRPHGARLSQ